MVDAVDLKSTGCKPVPVRVRPPVSEKLNVAGWSSQVARRAHNPEVAGSNPAPATKYIGFEPEQCSGSKAKSGDVAQLVRASGSYPLGPGFKSLRRYHDIQAALKGPLFSSRGEGDDEAPTTCGKKSP